MLVSCVRLLKFLFLLMAGWCCLDWLSQGWSLTCSRVNLSSWDRLRQPDTRLLASWETNSGQMSSCQRISWSVRNGMSPTSMLYNKIPRLQTVRLSARNLNNAVECNVDLTFNILRTDNIFSVNVTVCWQSRLSECPDRSSDRKWNSSATLTDFIKHNHVIIIGLLSLKTSCPSRFHQSLDFLYWLWLTVTVATQTCRPSPTPEVSTPGSPGTHCSPRPAPGDSTRSQWWWRPQCPARWSRSRPWCRHAGCLPGNSWWRPPISRSGVEGESSGQKSDLTLEKIFLLRGSARLPWLEMKSNRSCPLYLSITM